MKNRSKADDRLIRLLEAQLASETARADRAMRTYIDTLHKYVALKCAFDELRAIVNETREDGAEP